MLSKMTLIHKPQMKFIKMLFEAMLASHGRLNFRNISRYCNMSEKTISRNYRKPFDFAQLNKHLIEEMDFNSKRSIAVFDPSFIKKSGKKTHGLGKFWNGSSSRAEKGLEVGCVAIANVETKDCLAISVSQTEPDATDNQNRVDCYIKHIADARSYLPKNVCHLTVDGFFYNGRFVEAMKTIGLYTIGKVRSNAVLFTPYVGPKKTGRGRPKKYTGRFDPNDVNQYAEQITLEGSKRLLGAIVYSKALACNIKIVAIKNGKKKSLTMFFSTDLALSLWDIYKFYQTRYQIEFNFRDGKQHAGFMDCQSTNKQALDFHFNASLSLLNLIKVEDYLRHAKTQNRSLSVASYKNEYFNKSFIDRFFPVSLFRLNPEKYNIIYQQALSYGVLT